MTTRRFLWPLVLVTLANYVALVPYYLHNDASAEHPLPPVRAVVLVTLTLAWFLSGVRGLRHRAWWGRFVLLGFLVAEAALYAKTFATGAVVHQMHNPSDLVRAVFVIGYLSGAVAIVYIVLLMRPGGRSTTAPGGEATREDRASSHGEKPDGHRSIAGAYAS
jgi:hypothetical protein